jgi:pyruvate/2-oxoglutarate dehydrogenase complex dihydrolipoamide dehydrogenase (E3) component
MRVKPFDDTHAMVVIGVGPAAQSAAGWCSDASLSDAAVEREFVGGGVLVEL